MMERSSLRDDAAVASSPEHPDHEARWRRRQLVWLGYLPLVLVNAAYNNTSVARWVVLLLSIALIVWLVWRAMREQERSLLPLVGLTLGLGLLLAPDTLAANLFFAYAAGVAGHIRRTALALLLITVVVVVASAEAWVLHSLLIFSVGALVASFVGLVNLFFASDRRASLSLRHANAEIERLAAVAERERIARDLHDVLGHTLSLIALKSELAMRLAEREAPAAAAECRDVHNASRAALAEIRQVVRGYRTRLSDEIGRARALLDAARVDVDIDIPVTASADLSRDEEETLAFAIREGVTNVVRYAGAKRCHLRLWHEGDIHILQIEDDGTGVKAPEGNGLRGMRERIGALGGQLEIASTANGTQLRVAIPRGTGS